MIHDPDLLEQLSDYNISKFSGDVFRATRRNLNPLAASSSGGRWSPPQEYSVLYTSLSHDGALAEIVHHWSMLNPLPTKPVVIHQIRVKAEKTIKLLHADLGKLGIDMDDFTHMKYSDTQNIGAAVCFLGYDGLIIPSARWDCQNLILFTENINSVNLEVIQSEEIECKRKVNPVLYI